MDKVGDRVRTIVQASPFVLYYFTISSYQIEISRDRKKGACLKTKPE